MISECIQSKILAYMRMDEKNKDARDLAHATNRAAAVSPNSESESLQNFWHCVIVFIHKYKHTHKK